ncbi:hypothetical protein [Neolewinella agarilytica]|uniref:hypothetical protein n=1 Tax=Neolewinella agarilytica TaxID=478744 RepID=UPI00235385AD|nr:hypothetical protein [Neolewinella agarilytica]
MKLIRSILPTYLIVFFFGTLILGSCGEISSAKEFTNNSNQITCTNTSCQGTYTGPEFINGSDVAHQFSNKMSAAVGDKLKELYDKKQYSKVDFAGITMSTEGMGSGEVIYELKIPFLRVNSKCEAYTSFDHVGGWNHAPELQKRKKQLAPALMTGDELDISDLKRTKENLQEYWIQWRNKGRQGGCLGKNLLLMDSATNQNH